MRTRLTLDDDVLAEARMLAAKAGRPFQAVINEALRIGLLLERLDKKTRPSRRV